MVNKIVTRLRPRVRGITALVAAAILIAAPGLSAQDLSKRVVRVSVTDPSGRFVTSLGREGFTVVENGVGRTITDFSGGESPVSLAIVSAAPLPELSRFKGSNEELIQTTSLTDAVRQLAASKNARKVLVVTTGADTPAIPDGTEVFETSLDDVAKTVLKVLNQYTLQFESSSPAASVEVVLQPPYGLPPLQLNWN